ncbi:MAG: DUF1571 domain-containing protein [Planctomycetales bacterium]
MSHRISKPAVPATSHRMWAASAAILTLGAVAYGTRPDNTFLSSSDRGVEQGPPPPHVEFVSPADLSNVSAVRSVPEEFAPASAVQGAAALDENLRLLEQGVRRLESIDGYRATFRRQERVGGRLLDPETMRVSVRHAPYAVYLKWVEGNVGRELLYVEGRNDGRLLVRLDGWKGRMLPALSVDPHGSKAMEGSRYPATQFGMLALCRLLVRDRYADVAGGAGPRCLMVTNQRFRGRACTYFRLEYASPGDSDAARVYRKSVQIIDDELSLPLWIANYTWPTDGEGFEGDQALDEATLIEHYTYSDLDLAPRFADDEFDRAHPEYGFSR